MADDDVVARWLTVLRCGYASPCRAARCRAVAVSILRKSEANGRPLRQVELCARHAAAVVGRERARGLGVTERS